MVVKQPLPPKQVGGHIKHRIFVCSLSTGIRGPSNSTLRIRAGAVLLVACLAKCTGQPLFDFHRHTHIAEEMSMPASGMGTAIRGKTRKRSAAQTRRRSSPGSTGTSFRRGTVAVETATKTGFWEKSTAIGCPTESSPGLGPRATASRGILLAEHWG